MKKQSNYSEQVKSPLWQKKRLEVLNLRGFKCEICGNEKDQLHVHHRFYIKGRKIHEYDNDVLQVLCEKCHKIEHEKRNLKIDNPHLIEIVNILNEMGDDFMSNLRVVLTDFVQYDDIHKKLEDLVDIACYGNFDAVFDYVKLIANNHTMDYTIYQLEKELKINSHG